MRGPRTVVRAPLPGPAGTACRRALWPLGWLLIAALTVIFAPFVIVLSLAAGTAAAWPLARLWSTVLLWLAGADVLAEGVERLPRGRPAVIVSNHTSHLDALALAVALPEPLSFVAKKELYRIPVFGWALAALGFIRVDRGDTERAKAQMRRAVDRVRAGLWVLVFAEGTRSPDGRLQPFKKGGFHLALDARVPVVPVAVCGTHAILPKGAARIRRTGRVVVRVGRPILTEGMDRSQLEALRQRTWEAVAELLGDEGVRVSGGEEVRR